MEKKRLFRIMAKADGAILAGLAEKIKKQYSVSLVKGPQKALTMIQMREPVQSSLFYLGEAMVAEAVVELEGTRGIAVTMGDEFEKVLNMAVIDAACNKGVFTGEDTLLELEKEQTAREEKENAMHLKTMVNFTSLDQGVQEP